jgi:DNA-directed RNA polymerase subunit K/omega
MRYLVKLRYYPGDPLREIKKEDLQRIAGQRGLVIALETIGGEVQGNAEKTLDKALEEITQQVITIEGDQEPSLRSGLREIIAQYRAPRTVYALWGSNAAGMVIARETIEEMDGWW